MSLSWTNSSRNSAHSSLSTKWIYVVSFKTWPLSSVESAPLYWMAVLRSRLDTFEKKKCLPFPNMESNTGCSASRPISVLTDVNSPQHGRHFKRFSRKCAEVVCRFNSKSCYFNYCTAQFHQHHYWLILFLHLQTHCLLNVILICDIYRF